MAEIMHKNIMRNFKVKLFADYANLEISKSEIDWK